MKVPFRRNQTAESAAEPPTGSSGPQPSPATDSAAAGDSQPTLVSTALTPHDAAPLDPPPVAVHQPSAPNPSGNRAKLRRRMRYLRRAHELALRDLGGLVFDLHRFGKRNDQLVVGKLHALDAVDAELRAIERVLGDHREIVELKEPGITACVRCGALNGTDARFCSACGTQVDGPVSVAGAPPAAAAGSTAAHLPQTPATTTPQPAPQPGSAPPTAVVAPPVPPSGPAPAAPPLWSVPQQQPVESEPDKNTAGPDQP